MPVYLDNHATTALDPRVLESMLPYLTSAFGNASSRQNAAGWRAHEALEKARRALASCLGTRDPNEIVFTSGATEANNLAIKGVARGKRHAISVVTEHASVLEPLAALAREGTAVTLLPVDANGLVSPRDLAAALRPDTALVSVMLANNEIGVLQPITELSAICRARGVLFHCDAAAALGKIPVDVAALGVDLLTLSAHKLHGPQGVGALWKRRSLVLAPQQHGGNQEQGLRAGTPNLAGIVGFGAAAQLEEQGVAGLRDQLAALILARVPEAIVNGAAVPRLPGNLSLSFPGIDGEMLIAGLSEVSVSSGSACGSVALKPSHVLMAIGHSATLAHATLRIGLSRFTTEAEVILAADHIANRVASLKRVAA